MAEKGAPRKHLAARNWKLVGNADKHIFSPGSTAVGSVENYDSLDGDCFAVVDGNPWYTIIVRMAHVTIFVCSMHVPINALGC